MNRHIVPALAAACTTVGACSTNQGTGDNPATGVSASPTVDKGSVDPHTTVVDDTAAPQGYTMDSINQMIQDQEAESPGINQDMVSMAQEITADPAECAALIPTGVTYISKIVQNPDAIAARDFTNESTDATLSVAVSSDPQLSNHPRDVSVCESITRAHAGGSTSYTAAPMELRVDGADSVTAAEVTLTQSSSPPFPVTTAPSAASPMSRSTGPPTPSPAPRSRTRRFHPHGPGAGRENPPAITHRGSCPPRSPGTGGGQETSPTAKQG